VRSFFWVIACVATAVSVQSLLVVSALERLKLGDAYAGVFESVTLATSGIGGAIAGRTGDRVGHSRSLLFALGVQVVAFGLVVRSGGIAQFYAALGLSGIAYAAMLVGLAGLTAKLAPPDSAGAFMAIMRWIVQIVSALATAAAAFVVDHAGYATLFGSCIAPLAATMIVLHRLGKFRAPPSRAVI
jgi:MFS family permease